MSSLAMVRHAQASFLTDDYDRLSEIGIEQARLLGRYWVRRQVGFDLVFCGPRRRQMHTQSIVAEEMEKAARPWPQARVLEGLDEYPAEEIMRAFAPQVVASDEELRRISEEFKTCQDQPRRRQLFQQIFEPVTRKWLRGELHCEGVESWQAFRRRVLESLETIMRLAGRGSRVAVFTSGGPIAVTMEKALGHSPETTLELSWAVRNAAHSEFLFTSRRFSLAAFNSHPYLEEARLLTFR